MGRYGLAFIVFLAYAFMAILAMLFILAVAEDDPDQDFLEDIKRQCGEEVKEYMENESDSNKS